MRTLVLLSLALCACADASDDGAGVEGVGGQVTFAVRGRLDDPGDVSWRLDDAPGPVDADVLERCVERAQRAWSQTCSDERIRFRRAREGERADVTYGWRTGTHDACRPFGRGVELAHTGPMGPGTFVHFDAEREWSEDGERGASLALAALHETGHVLGLDHTTDATAVMAPGYESTAERLGASDLAGVRSLYWPEHSGPGLVVRQAGVDVVRLHGVLDVDRDWTVVDVDRDGRAELLVWRLDVDGLGALQVFRFEARAGRPVLARTEGPFRGVLQPGARVHVRRDAGGRLLVVSILTDGRLRVLELGADGAPALVAPGRRLQLSAGVADADGDGVLDGPLEAAEFVRVQSGDLDGDGRMEEVGGGMGARH